MGTFSGSDSPYFLDHPNITQHQVPVKTEASSSPDLSPAPPSLQQFHFKFHSQAQSSHASLPSSRNQSESPALLPPQPIYRFGSVAGAYNSMSGHPWPATTSFQHHPSSATSNTTETTNSHHRTATTAIHSPQPINGHSTLDEHPSNSHNTTINGHANHKYENIPGRHSNQLSMSYSDDYDDVSELADLPLDSHATLAGLLGSSSTPSNERTIRRRSSKACDQCRKSKCKCERTGPNEPCKSCVMLGTACTFLGPSRKRGPPKGYIDAIEARLHQTEALLGIMLATEDQRAQSLLRDIAKDPLAKEIINRVDNSPYGVKGRKREDAGALNKKPGHTASSTPDSTASGLPKTDSGRMDLASMHPSNEWQDRVSTMLGTTLGNAGGSSSRSQHEPASATDSYHSGRPNLRVNPYGPSSGIPPPSASDDGISPGRRQRRRIGHDDYPFQPNDYPYPTSASAPSSAVSLHHENSPAGRRLHRGSYTPLSPMNSHFALNGAYQSRDERRSSSPIDSASSDNEEELTGAVGQLSLNEDEQLRYHGKASGLHLLGVRERVDGRNEGGIWRFPKARVWPPLPTSAITMNSDDEFMSQLPEQSVQQHLLDLYFTYVHPSFPVVHKRAFSEAFKAGNKPDSPRSPEGQPSGSPFNRPRQCVPTILLLAMFALSARYDDGNSPPASDGSMWAAGDEYLDRAKVILDGTYASSRPSTCQALLLMGHREIGIGAMAQAWTYIGMAIRMAQDLGMHRSADGWARQDLGGRLFGEIELQERKRIWYACVIMDKYVSSYIGRPLMIFERDFDTLMPSAEDPEEHEDWSPHPSHFANGQQPPTVPGRIISCFNACASLSGILSMIVQAIYAVRPVSSRHAESTLLEGLLDKWYLELPEHLRYDAGSSKQPITLPHVLTLHMQYWCAVLLLHRPFIRHVYSSKHKQSEDSDDVEVRAIAEKSYELCASAANHITSIVAVYAERYSLSRCSVFLCYYIFTASIMHITSLTVHPSDPQARIGLGKCMDALRMMEIVWPSAGRALELLRGAKVNLEESELAMLANHADRNKRPAEQSLDDSFERSHPSATAMDYASLRASHVPTNYPSTEVYNADGYTNHSPLVPASSSNYRQWPSDSINSHSFNTPLSTSVLPQLYSTGLVDERASSSNRIHSHSDQQNHGHGNTRYPQYWNDYSTFPQLGTAYGGIHEQSSVPQQQQQSTSQMYMSDQHYNIYNNQPYQDR
ncbi:fungal-specific transcription factor domain-containing protein [Crucibulum laeve]|uniref:Fungal-specific transcription factor domain-containing protein n=1 Tax=Crucibulum laeve TaxID=68775 RepID=A0A5C3LEW6_9AGAR|nr:fungal-specific transcription factor domain-containing protein [Crucibulum laeve]